MLVEIDVDGVIVDLSDIIERQTKAIWPEFKSNMLTDYGMSIIRMRSPEAFKNVIEGFNDPKVMSTAKEYPHARAALKKICKLDAAQVHLHTNVKPGIVEYRNKQLKQLRTETGCNFEITVNSEDVKPTYTPDVLIEDCVENIVRSSAPIKILIAQPYNRNSENLIAKNSTISYVAKDLLDAANFLSTMF